MFNNVIQYFIRLYFRVHHFYFFFFSQFLVQAVWTYNFEFGLLAETLVYCGIVQVKKKIN